MNTNHTYKTSFKKFIIKFMIFKLLKLLSMHQFVKGSLHNYMIKTFH